MASRTSNRTLSRSTWAARLQVVAWVCLATLAGGPVSAVRRAGMAAVQRMPMLKHWFMDEARGVAGDLPEMLRA